MTNSAPAQSRAPRLTSFTASNGITTTLDYDSLGRIQRRYTAQGYSDYTYEDGTNWLLRETWHAAKIDNTLNPTNRSVLADPFNVAGAWASGGSMVTAIDQVLQNQYATNLANEFPKFTWNTYRPSFTGRRLFGHIKR